MLFLFLISFAICKVIEIEEDFSKLIENENDSLLVYAYIKNSRTRENENKILKHDFSVLQRISEIFPTAVVGAVNCDKYSELCKKYFVEPQNSLTLFKNYDKIAEKFEKTSQYTNEISLYAISSFISYKTKHEPTIKMNEQQYLGQNNFTDFITKHEYNVIFYTSRDSRMSQLLIPTIAEISDAFSKDINIGVAEVQCNQEYDFCIEKNVEFAPTIRIYKNHTDTIFTDYINGTREFQYIMDFINRECNSYRQSEGKVNMSLYFDQCSYKLMRKYLKQSKSKNNKYSDLLDYVHESNEKCGYTFINRVLNCFIYQLNDEVNIRNEDEREAKLWIHNQFKYLIDSNTNENEL